VFSRAVAPGNRAPRSNQAPLIFAATLFAAGTYRIIELPGRRAIRRAADGALLREAPRGVSNAFAGATNR
jgi:hypothetical protein